MQDFDYAAAERGATVCTRDGNPVRILCFNLKYDGYPIVAAIDRHAQDEGEFIETYTTDGKAIYGSIDHNDLMMSDDDYLEKLERGEYDKPVRKNNGAYVAEVECTVLKTESPYDDDYWRRMYAGMALQGLVASDKWRRMEMGDRVCVCVEMADALIEELKKEKE